MSNRGFHSSIWLKAAISLLAVVMLVARLAFPHIQIDAIVWVLAAVALIPWVAHAIRSVELPGGLKVELQEMKRDIAVAKGAAESARQHAELATVQTGFHTQRAIREDVEVKWPELSRKLVSEYNLLREQHRPSVGRTTLMTQVVGEMIKAAHQFPDWSPEQALASGDRGTRLLAYAHLYAVPNFSCFTTLVSSACNFADDNRSFGQYWSVLALQRVVTVGAEQGIGRTESQSLAKLAARFEPGSDRHAEMSRLMCNLEQRLA